MWMHQSPKILILDIDRINLTRCRSKAVDDFFHVFSYRVSLFQFFLFVFVDSFLKEKRAKSFRRCKNRDGSSIKRDRFVSIMIRWNDQRVRQIVIKKIKRSSKESKVKLTPYQKGAMSKSSQKRKRANKCLSSRMRHVHNLTTDTFRIR